MVDNIINGLKFILFWSQRFRQQNGFSGSLFGAHLPTTATVTFSGPEISPPFETTSFDKVDTSSAFVSDLRGTKKNR